MDEPGCISSKFMMHTKCVNLEFAHYSDILTRLVMVFLDSFPNKNQRDQIFSRRKSLQLFHCECLRAVMTLCKRFVSAVGWEGRGWGGILWAKQILFAMVTWRTRLFFFSEMWHRKGGRGQNQIVAYGCLLLLLSWIHSQCRHCVRRIGIRGATMRQSGISEHECLMSPLLLLKSGQCRLQSEWLMRWY